MRFSVSISGPRRVSGEGVVAMAALPSSASRSALPAAFGDGGIRVRVRAPAGAGVLALAGLGRDTVTVGNRKDDQ
jgi:hypothetical protein